MRLLCVRNYVVVGLLVQFFAINPSFAGKIATAALNAVALSTTRFTNPQTVLGSSLRAGQAALAPSASSTSSAFSTLSSSSTRPAGCSTYGNNNLRPAVPVSTAFSGLSQVVGHLRTNCTSSDGKSKRTWHSYDISENKQIVDSYIAELPMILEHGRYGDLLRKNALNKFLPAVAYLTQAAEDLPEIKDYLKEFQKNEKFQMHVRLVSESGDHYNKTFMQSLLLNPYVMESKNLDRILGWWFLDASSSRISPETRITLTRFFTSKQFASSHLATRPDIQKKYIEFVHSAVKNGALTVNTDTTKRPDWAMYGP